MLSVSDFLIPVDACHENLKNIQWLQRKKKKNCSNQSLHSFKSRYFLSFHQIFILSQPCNNKYKTTASSILLRNELLDATQKETKIAKQIAPKIRFFLNYTTDPIF